MKRDEYGQQRKLKHPEWGVKINLTRCRELWRKIQGPRKTEVNAQLLKAQREDREFEQFIEGAERKRISKEQLVEHLSRELRKRKNAI